MSILKLAEPWMLDISPKARAVRSLRNLLERGGLREGDRLPPEGKLAVEFDVSRVTLRSALDVLEREGLVMRKRNIGCFTAVCGRSTGGLMSRTIAMVTNHELASDTRVFGGTSASVVSGVIDRVSRNGMNFLRVGSDPTRSGWVHDLLAVRPSGVILSCWNQPIEWQLEVLTHLSSNGVPVATWGDAPQLHRFDCVVSDHVSGARELVRCLARAGRHRILRLWTLPSETPWIDAHNRGYDFGISEAGLESIPPVYVEGLVDRGDPPSEAIFRMRARQFAGYLAEHLHSGHPIDAIMTATDSEAQAVIAACRLFNATSVAVTGYDNRWHDAPERQWESAPLFATVDKSNHRLGEELVALLLQRIAGALPLEPQMRLIEQSIIVTE